MARSEIRALTGLRGIAAIFVVVFHEAGNFAGTGPAATFLRHGYNAVDLFFVLSGFVMALTYGAKFKEGCAHREYFSFLGRRIARIYPLYALATLFSFGISEVHLSQIPPVSHPLTTLILNLAAVQTWGFAGAPTCDWNFHPGRCGMRRRDLQLYRKTWPDYFARVTIPAPRPFYK